MPPPVTATNEIQKDRLMTSIRRITLVLCPLLLATCSASGDTVVDNLAAEGTTTGFGEQAPAYWAQSFIPAARRLRELTLRLASSSGPDDTDFRILIVETAGVDLDIIPTSVLFESATVTFPFDNTFPINNGIFTDVTVDFPNIELDMGTQYAFVLDAFVANDGIGGSAGSPFNNDYLAGLIHPRLN